MVGQQAGWALGMVKNVCWLGGLPKKEKCASTFFDVFKDLPLVRTRVLLCLLFWTQAIDGLSLGVPWNTQIASEF